MFRLTGSIALALILSGVARADVSRLVARIKTVGPEGAGGVEAGAASRELAALGPGALLEILASMDDASPAAANWLRAAVDAVAERAMAGGKALPVAEIEAFVRDRRHATRVRRLAYEWLTRADPSAPDRLIPGMLDDPSVELRRDAVEREIHAAQALDEAGKKDAGLAAWRKLFPQARDPDQVERIAKRLEEAGEHVDLTRHFGCIRDWRLIAPFDNREKKGFDAVYPPETEIDPKAEYDGKSSKVRWQEYSSADTFGTVDLNQVIGKHMGAVAYATAEIDSDAARPIEVRAGSRNAIKIWLNGELLFTRHEYHHGSGMDQYRATGALRAGRNVLLLKLCQNEQTEDWAQDWKFQARVCDATGGGIR